MYNFCNVKLMSNVVEHEICNFHLKLKAYRATRSFLFPLTLAPLHDNHRFKTETVQCSAGFGNLAPGISSSLSSTSSPFLSTNRGDKAAISNQRASPKTVPAFIWSVNRFQDYFEFRNGQFCYGPASLRLLFPRFF